MIKGASTHILNIFSTLVKTQFHKTIKKGQTNNDTEFLSLKTFFLSKGIIHQTSAVCTLQQNVTVECEHRHILNVTLALSPQACLSSPFWGDKRGGGGGMH